MTVATTRKPTKKAFHFPKSEATEATAQEQSEAAKPAAAAEAAVKSKRKKAVPKAAAKPARAAAEAPAPAPAAAPAEKVKAKRVKKDKVVRDSFTMPKTDYQRIALLKRKCLEAGVAVRKSELLRAGLQLLESAPQKRLLAAIEALETVKTGRPAKGDENA
ncbi:hypothetical protein M3I54_08305 [Paraburkholderia sp. CNPSo 3274]|uniref:hypothetical protein n=1 Tax=unclassified Paraburkholderia TaxID=2615204 RepID=UPI0020B68068|nr:MULTISPECIES: hypothetical protein [unclassified Paraburkholderia]MCP3706987.1 hypothetical protein [Paraburkholderia sp. CNPSo 3274]MCX5542673.1 hypothetical protein [Paraburkholderia sp. CNPSo 3076]